jgi:hypothetical protein
MKTTLDLDDELLRRAKQAALDRRTTLRAIVEDALARALGPSTAEVAPPRTVTWPQRPIRHASGRPTADEIAAAIARDRDDPADDPARLARRLGTRQPEPDQS